MFCSLLKPNHSSTVFFARKTEINLFISLSPTNKPYTQLTIITVSSYQTKHPFSFIVQRMPSPPSAKTKTLYCWSGKLTPTREKERRANNFSSSLYRTRYLTWSFNANFFPRIITAVTEIVMWVNRLLYHPRISISSQTLAPSSMCGLFIHLQQLQWSVLSTCVHTHRCTHARTQTETLPIFPSFPSPQQNTNVGNESAAARKSKPEKSLASAKTRLTTGLGSL